MIRIIGLFLLLTSFAGFGQKSGSDEQQIKSLVQNAFDGVWSDFDTTAVDNFHTADFLLLEHGEVWTNEIIKGYQRTGKANAKNTKRINNFEFLKIEINGETAWAAYKNFATIYKDGEISRNLEWLESVNAVKTSNGWKLKLMHSTRVIKED